MSGETTDKKDRIKPMMIIPKKAMTKRDIGELRKNGVCVVEAENPLLVRFCEPPPEGYSVQERAAIRLSRFLLSADHNNNYRDRSDICALYAQLIIEGTPLSNAYVARVKKVLS